jgi:uncharacterized protein (TIGR02246 family)
MEIGVRSQESGMRDESKSGAAGALLGVALILLLLVGGVGFYWMLERQRELTATLELARKAEAEARGQGSGVRGQKSGVTTRASGDAVRGAVESVLRAQQDAWNRGDVEAFVEHYWKSGELTFSSGGKTTRGWEETVRGYRERYPTREKMGRLAFEKLEVTPLGDDAALVLGEWKLERESEPVSGSFSLVFRMIDGRWVIVHDHTSRAVE